MNFLNNIPQVTRNIILLCALVFLFTGVLPIGDGLFELLALHNIGTPEFKVFQVVTHIFVHGGIGHLFFNMLALYFFGSMLERVWGEKKFFIFFMATGIGAGLLTLGVDYLMMQHVGSQIGEENIRTLLDNGTYLPNGIEDMDALIKDYFSLYYKSMVGASGAIFGLLSAIFVLFPNTELMLLFFPMPIKVKYLFPFSILLEIVLMLADFEWDFIAHSAHLGGALIGFIIVKAWQKDRNSMY